MSDPIGGFGKPGDVLHEISEADLQSLNAAGQHVAERYGCMVTIGGDPPNFRGSGTLVRIGEATFVATAKHLFEGLDPSAQACFWWGHQNEHECVWVGNIRWPNADIDVAAARLTKKPEHATPLEKLDLDPSNDGSELWIVTGISQGGVDPDFQTKTLSVVWWTLGLMVVPGQITKSDDSRLLSPAECFAAKVAPGFSNYHGAISRNAVRHAPKRAAWEIAKSHKARCARPDEGLVNTVVRVATADDHRAVHSHVQCEAS